MSARDLFHDHVKAALIKDGWTITHDPLRLQWRAKKNILIDLGGEKLLVAEKNKHKIAVEVKSFVGISELTDLYNAIGQFIIYRATLALREPDRELFLAIRKTVYEQTFTDPVVESLIQKEQIKIIVFDPETREIVKWMS
jgi:XisH protein